MNLKTVLTEVETWPVEDRIRLVQEVWDGVLDRGYVPELTAEQAIELDRRLAADEAAPEDTLPWEEIKAQALCSFSITD
jgi:putative addiction module component (TIGR02574 family)